MSISIRCCGTLNCSEKHRSFSCTGKLIEKKKFVIATAFGARALSALGGSLLSFVVARTAGAESLGQFAIFLSLLGAMTIIARRGIDTLLIRAVAWSECQNRDVTSVALLRNGISLVLGPAVLLGLGVSVLLTSEIVGKAFPGTVISMPIVLPTVTILALVAGYCKGRSRAWLAPIFEIGGISFLAAALIITVFLISTEISEAIITIIFTASALLMLMASKVVIRHDMRDGTNIPPLEIQQKNELSKGQLGFTTIAFANYLTQAGSLLLAAPFLTDFDLGLLRAAERLALIVFLPMLVIEPIYAPRAVQLSRSGDEVALRCLTGQAIFTSTGLAACAAFPLSIWPDHALALMGSEFASAAPYLRVMVSVQFILVAIGPIAMIFNMSGRESASVIISLCSLGLAVILIPIFSHLLGAPGFVATCCILAALKIILTCFFASRLIFKKEKKNAL